MSYVLDTHAALWNAVSAVNMGKTAARLLAGLDSSRLIISDVTLSELARLITTPGKSGVSVAGDALGWLKAFAASHTIMPVSAAIAWRAASFSFPHRDPCDRHILATAAVLRLPLVTVDGVLAKFAADVGVRVLW